ncbi:MAG: hydrolase [Leptospira sp.]|nr:hydrolase [Leptospira sp.]
MAEENPIEGKYTTQQGKISWKYYLIFSSWLFLCLLSFYLGMGLIQWDENKVTNNTANVKTANMGDSESLSFKNVLEEIFSGDNPNSLTEENTKSTVQLRNFPDPVDKPIRASTWFSDYEAMKKVVHLYDEIHPFIYSMKGGLTNNGELANSWSSTSKRERVEELRKLNPNVKIIPTIFRWENPKEKISENIGMNGRSDIRDKHIQIILNEIETFGYDGIDIDYEGMGCEKKEKFEEFIVLLSKEMKKRNKILSIAVHPKTPAGKVSTSLCKASGKTITVDYREKWRGPMAHDYEFLAKHVDRFKIMAYELHPRKYHNPGPGPQAPNTWLKDIIRYSKKKVPSEKLYMAIPTYGYDWALNCTSRAKSVYHSDVQRIKARAHKLHQPTNINSILSRNEDKKWSNLTKFSYVHQNKTYEDPTLWYNQDGCDRVAFFMNRKAFEEKMNLLRRYEIGGFSFWQLIGDNDPEISVYLELLMTNQTPNVPVAYDLYEEEAFEPFSGSHEGELPLAKTPKTKAKKSTSKEEKLTTFEKKETKQVLAKKQDVERFEALPTAKPDITNR